MTSERQRAANRANAKKSTGPKSAAGKSRAGQNAYKHGLAATASQPSNFGDREKKLANKILEGMAGQIGPDQALEIAVAQLRVETVRAVMSKLSTASPCANKSNSNWQTLRGLGRYMRFAIAARHRAIWG